MTTTYTVAGRDYASPDDLKSLSGRQIVEVFNAIADEPVKRFTDRTTAIKRTWALIQAKVRPNDMPECLIDEEPKPGKGGLLTLFRSAAAQTVHLDDIVRELGVGAPKARGMIDHARSTGHPIVSLGRGTKAWRLM
ncbi:MAG: hypothetical protein U1E42_08405 [Rhodospirillales bacterium]